MIKNKRTYRKFIAVFTLVGVVLMSALVVISTYKKYNPTIIFIGKESDYSIDFWKSFREGLYAAQDEFDGITLKIQQADGETDIDGQIKLMEEAIEAKPDAIILVPTDIDQLVPVTQKAMNKKIKVILADCYLNMENCPPLIATDNIIAGEKAGNKLAEYLSPGAKIGVIGQTPGASTAIDRTSGVKTALNNNGLVLTDIRYCNSQEALAISETEKMLKEHPDIKGIVGVNEVSAMGAALAVKKMGLTDKVCIVGFDSSLREVALIEEGVIKAAVVQKPFNMGYAAVNSAVQAVKGIRLPASHDTGSVLITKSNMYNRENQKLIFPFTNIDTNRP